MYPQMWTKQKISFLVLQHHLSLAPPRPRDTLCVTFNPTKSVYFLRLLVLRVTPASAFCLHSFCCSI